MVVALSRPDLLEARPTWGGGKVNATTVLLEPLTDGDSEALVREPPRERQRLRGREGPHHRGGRRESVLRRGDRVDADRRRTPGSGRGIVARRRRPVARGAAAHDLRAPRRPPGSAGAGRARDDPARLGDRGDVLGRRRRGTRDGDGDDDDDGRRGLLRSLVRKELLRPERGVETAADLYRFRHVLIRDAAYEAIPKQLRSDLHERFAGWLQTWAGSRVEEYEEILGYHLEQAHRYLIELGPADEHARALSGRAGARLAVAGRRAAARGDMAASVGLLRRAARLLPADEPLRLETLMATARQPAPGGRHRTVGTRASTSCRRRPRRRTTARSRSARCSGRSGCAS